MPTWDAGSMRRRGERASARRALGRWVRVLGLLLAACLSNPTTAAAGPRTAAVDRRITLDNGLRLLLSRQRSVPIVAIECLVDGGARVDPATRPGLAGFTAALLDEGTRQHSSREIAQLADSLGGSFSAGAAEDWINVSAFFLARDFETALELVAASLSTPTFPPEEVERIRRQILGSLEASEDEPGWVANRAFLAALYGQAPYGHPIAGNPATVKALRREDLVAFHEDEMSPERTICVIVGDVEVQTMETNARRLLGDWAAPAHDRADTRPAPLPPSAPRVVVVDRPLEQANVVLGQSGVSRDDPDYFPLLVMNHILGGGGFTSRLLDTVRTRAGLAYGVYSHFIPNRLPGPFEIVLQTKVASTAQAIDLVRREVRRMHDTGATADELAAAQDYLTGNFPLRLDSTAKLADLFARIEYFGLGPGYITTYAERVRAVSSADVKRVAQAHLRPDALVTVVVGPRETLAGSGIVESAGMPSNGAVAAP